MQADVIDLIETPHARAGLCCGNKSHGIVTDCGLLGFLPQVLMKFHDKLFEN